MKNNSLLTSLTECCFLNTRNTDLLLLTLGVEPLRSILGVICVRLCYAFKKVLKNTS